MKHILSSSSRFFLAACLLNFAALGAFAQDTPSVTLTQISSDPFTVPPGQHAITSMPLPGLQVDSALLSQGTIARQPAATVENFSEKTSEEFSGTLTSAGGLLILPSTFSPGWRLAVLPPDRTKPSGFALFDALHSVDRASLCEALAKEITQQSRKPVSFAQVNTGAEPQKAGVLPEKTDAFVKLCRETYGLDIAGLMGIPPLDEPPPPGADRALAEAASLRTHRWAERCVAVHQGAGSLFPICQGGLFGDLRRRSASFIAGLGAEGNAIGGLSLGESKETTWAMLETSVAVLPGDKPRYLMGVGAPEDLLDGVGRGVDMFDCVLPTRLGRNGAVFTPDGKLNLRNAACARATGPIDEHCDCETCSAFSLGYLHHLFRCEELLGYRLASIHNLRFLVRLLEEARRAVVEGRFPSFQATFRLRYTPPDEAVRAEQRRRWQAARARWSEAGDASQDGGLAEVTAKD